MKPADPIRPSAALAALVHRIESCPAEQLAPILLAADPGLLGPLDGLYWGWVQDDRPEASKWRSTLVREALDEFNCRFRSPVGRCTAYPVPTGDSWAIESVVGQHVLDLPRWGVACQLDSDHAARWQRAVFERARHRLFTTLRGIESVGRWLADRGPLRTPQADPLGHPFEYLMRDLLASAWPARLAPFIEDWTEQTDLRVNPPGFKSRRGARLQLGLSVAPAELDRKRAQAKRHRVVLLTPLTLALAAENDLPFRQAIPGAPRNVGSRARAVRDLFTKALGKPWRDPRGPAFLISDEIRGGVQRAVAKAVRELPRATGHRAVRRVPMAPLGRRPQISPEDAEAPHGSS